MAVRNIVKVGDSILTKKCRPVEKIDDRILTLLDDMAETLEKADGAGLAAPQVGVLRRVVIINVGDENGLIELINPEIISSSGEQTDVEGCLSYPGQFGEVTRPNVVTVRAADRNGNIREITGEGLLARAICHECDHLDGKMFMELVTRWLDSEEQ